MKKLFLLFGFLFSFSLSAQLIIENGTVTACSGTFYDSGGDLNSYLGNENYIFTICPEFPGQFIELNFTSFVTQGGEDLMTIYNSDTNDATLSFGTFSGNTTPGLVSATTTNVSGCITIEFTSSPGANFQGWSADISCKEPCQTINSQVDTAFPAPNVNGFIKVCPDEEITLIGSGLFSSNGAGAAYEWDLGDGSTQLGQTATFSYSTPGVYIVNLNIRDTNTSNDPEGCANTNLINQVIQVGTVPDFVGTAALQDAICFGDSTTIEGVVTPTPFINDCTPPVSELTPLPDGNGAAYRTCITVDCYDSDLTLDTIDQLVDICLNIEHSWLGDLEITIISPNGQFATLHAYPGGSSTYLGAPNDDPSNAPGVGADYCFSMSGTTLLKNGATVQAGDPRSDSIAPGTYLPEDSFVQLIGSPLNGDWCIEIIDNLGQDDGYIFSWGLNFDPNLQPPELSFTPEITTESWDADGTIIEITDNIITVQPPAEGEYCYTYRAFDDIGCEYTEEVCIEVYPELIYQDPNDLFICDTGTAAGIFNLTENDAIILAPTPVPVDFEITYHESQADADADSNPITATDAASYSGTDSQIINVRFEYKTSGCYVTDSFSLYFISEPSINPVTDIPLCDDLSNDGTELFDLSQQSLTILGAQSASSYEVSYYTSFADADAATNALPTMYSNIYNPEPIFVRVEGAGGSGCYISSPTPVFNLIVNNKATASPLIDLKDCDDDLDGYVGFDLERRSTDVLGAQSPLDFTVSYHASQGDANNNINPLVSPYTNTIQYTQTIYVRVEENGLASCYETTQFNIVVNPLPSTLVMDPLEECDDDADGFVSFTLTDKDTEAVGGQADMVVSYHASQGDANNNINPLASPYLNTDQDFQTIFIRLQNTITLCHSVMPLDLVVNPLPVPITPTLPPECDDDFDGLTSFNFTGLDLIVKGSQTGMVVSYHVSQSDANTSSNALSSTYTNTTEDTQTIFIRLETTATGCYATTTFDLEVLPLPVIPAIIDYVLCDITGSGGLQALFDLSTKSIDIINGQNSSIAYYASQADADADTNVLPNLYQNTSSPQTLFVSLTDISTGCSATGSFTLIVNPLPFLVTPTPLEICDDGTPDGRTQIDLSIKDDEIRGGNSNYSISYHLTQSDADAGVSPLPIIYTNTTPNTQTIFVRGQDITTPCYTTKTLELVVIQAPVANTPPAMPYCDPDNDGYGAFVLTDSDDEITGGAAGFTITYHETFSDANNGVNALASPYNNVVADTQTIFARVESATVVTDCATIVDFVLNIYPTPQLLTPTALELCDDNLDEIVQFDLSDRVGELLNGIALSDVEISFYKTEEDASSSNNAISTPLAYSNISNPQTVWIRVEYPPAPAQVSGCEKLTSLELIVNPLPVIVQPTPLPLCDDAVADSFTAFDLTIKNTEITLGDGSLEVVYYTSLLDAESATNAIADPTAYTNQAIGIAPANPQTLYVRVTDLDTGCFDLTTLTIRVLPNPTPRSYQNPLELCDNTNSGDGFEVFDLKTEETYILNGELGVSATYHESLEDAQAGENAIVGPETYTNTETPVQTIYVRVTNDLTGCYTLLDFDIIVHPLPKANAVADMIACELNTDNFFDFDLEQQSSLILGGQDPSIFEVTYHTSLTDAKDGVNFLRSPYTNVRDPEVIFVRVFNNITRCENTQLQFSLEVHEAAQATTPLDSYVLCDDNVETDGDPTNDSVQFDLSTQDGLVLNGQAPSDYTVSYYANQADADQGINALPTLYENGINPQVIIARVDNDIQVLDITRILIDSSVCYETARVTLEVNPLPIVDIDMDYILCLDTNGTQVLAPLNIETGLSAVDYTFIWSDAAGAVVGTGSSYAPSQGGNYTLEVFDATLFTQCAAPVEVFTVTESTPPLLTAQVSTAAFASTHVIQAAATGLGIYEYSLDQGPWGNSGMFIDVTPGEHVVTARDLNGCGEAQELLYIIDYPLYLTPNGDGYNDIWNIVGVANQANAKILIFDRYGKLLKQISPSGSGWDGTYNGAQLPSSDYWFTLEYTDPTTGNPEMLRAHFSLKR